MRISPPPPPPPPPPLSLGTFRRRDAEREVASSAQGDAIRRVSSSRGRAAARYEAVGAPSSDSAESAAIGSDAMEKGPHRQAALVLSASAAPTRVYRSRCTLHTSSGPSNTRQLFRVPQRHPQVSGEGGVSQLGQFVRSERGASYGSFQLFLARRYAGAFLGCGKIFFQNMLVSQLDCGERRGPRLHAATLAERGSPSAPRSAKRGQSPSFLLVQFHITVVHLCFPATLCRREMSAALQGTILARFLDRGPRTHSDGP